MRICFLRFISLDTTIGYTETLDLVNYMSSKGNKIFLIISKSKKSINLSNHFNKGVVVYQIPSILLKYKKSITKRLINYILYTIFSFFILMKLQIKEKLDFIHYYPETSFPVFVFSRFFKNVYRILDVRKPTLIQSRELTLVQAEELDLNRKTIPIIISFYIIIEKISLLISNGIITITKGVQNYIKARLKVFKIDRNNSMIIPCSVDLNSFDKNKISSLDVKEKFGIDEDEKIILYIGSISVGREFQRVLKIFSEIVKKKYKVKLMLLGRIDIKLRKLIETLDIHSHTFITYVPHYYIFNYIKIADVCLSYIPDTATYKYSCPLKVLEYMSMEKPVVATNIYAHRQLIENGRTGILTDSEENSFMKTIIDTLNNLNAAEKIGKNARKFVKEHYSIEVVGSKYYKFLNTLRKSRKLSKI